MALFKSVARVFSLVSVLCIVYLKVTFFIFIMRVNYIISVAVVHSGVLGYLKLRVEINKTFFAFLEAVAYFGFQVFLKTFHTCSNQSYTHSSGLNIDPNISKVSHKALQDSIIQQSIKAYIRLPC